MKINRILCTAALAGLTVAITGCVVTSVYPFYFEKDVAFEPALVGDWKKASQPDEHWKFEQAGGNGYRVTSVSQGHTTLFQGHVFKLHGQTFLDLTSGDWTDAIQPEPVPSHFLAHIVQLAPMVKLLPMNYDWLKELVAKDPKAIRHVAIRNGEKPENRRIVLTADTAELQRFIVKHLGTEAAWEPAVELIR